jgi:hypothetical protein
MPRTHAAGNAHPSSPHRSNSHPTASRRRCRRSDPWDSTAPPHNRPRNNRRCRNIPLVHWDSNRDHTPRSRPDSMPRCSCIARRSSRQRRAPPGKRPSRSAEPGSAPLACWWAVMAESWVAGWARSPVLPCARPRHRRARSPRPSQYSQCQAALSARCAGCAQRQATAPARRTADRP